MFCLSSRVPRSRSAALIMLSHLFDLQVVIDFGGKVFAQKPGDGYDRIHLSTGNDDHFPAERAVYTLSGNLLDRNLLSGYLDAGVGVEGSCSGTGAEAGNFYRAVPAPQFLVNSLSQADNIVFGGIIAGKGGARHETGTGTHIEQNAVSVSGQSPENIRKRPFRRY